MAWLRLSLAEAETENPHHLAQKLVLDLESEVHERPQFYPSGGYVLPLDIFVFT